MAAAGAGVPALSGPGRRPARASAACPAHPARLARAPHPHRTTPAAGDGQLSLGGLASSTFSSLLPKIETQGQLGRARWRLVSAPSLPSLLSLEPGADPGNLLASLTLGTEVELSLGGGLRAALSHKQVRGGGQAGRSAGGWLRCLRLPAAACCRLPAAACCCHLLPPAAACCRLLLVLLPPAAC
jgi:hypothetical protein